MSNEIISVIDHLCQKFGIAVDFASGEILPLIQDFISRCSQYLIATKILSMVICVFFIIVFVAIMFITDKAIKNEKEWAYDKFYKDASLTAFLLTIFSGALIVFLAIAFISNSYGLVKTIYMPELSVYEYLLQFIK